MIGQPAPAPTLSSGLAESGPLLRLDGVSAGYGRLEVLHEVSLEVFASEVVAIIGPNGAGKSTVLKTAMGFLHPSTGQVSFEGRVINGWRTHQLVRLGLGYVPQGRVV